MPTNSAEKLRKLNEEYEDRLFRIILDDAAEQEGKLLLYENEQLKSIPDNIPSQKDIDRFAWLLDSHLKKSGKKRKKRSISKIFARIAIVLLVLIITASIMILTVHALRVRVLNFLISIDPN